jgi:hypothetical protein
LFQLKKAFWSNGEEKSSILDKTQYWLVYELEDGMYLVIDGNHRRIILIDKKIES